MILQNLHLQVPKKDFNMEETEESLITKLKSDLSQKDKVEIYLRKGDSVKELNSRNSFLEFLQSEPDITEWSIAFAKLVLAECVAYRCELNPRPKNQMLIGPF